MTSETAARSVLLVGPRPVSGSLPADLEADRFTVLLAADANEVRGALRTSCPSAVIVDLDMPGVGGLEVIARVRETSPDTETVIITGKSSVESAVAAVRHGVFDYLTKPCKLADIQAVLERVRRKREITVRLRRDCPWDREQTPATIVPHTIEEAYELADVALAGPPDAKFVDELGDLLFQPFILSLMAWESGAGDLSDVAEGIAEKLGIGEGTVRSHVHVLLQKLQVSNRTQAALIWLTTGARQ